MKARGPEGWQKPAPFEWAHNLGCQMPLFFFHLLTDDGVERDQIGLELDSVEAAYLEAMEAIPGMVCDFRIRGQSPFDYAFEIVDADDRHLMEVPFREILNPVAKSRFR